MPNKFLPVICLVLTICFFSCSDRRGQNVFDLREGFEKPPQIARPKVYWWWLNGYVDSVRVRAELQAMKDAGIGGVDIFEIGVPPDRDPEGLIPAGPAFMSEASLKMIQLAVREAAKLDMEVGLGVASSWNAGGSWVEPRHAAKTLYSSKVTIRGHKDVKLKLPFLKLHPRGEAYRERSNTNRMVVPPTAKKLPSSRFRRAQRICRTPFILLTSQNFLMFKLKNWSGKLPPAHGIFTGTFAPIQESR